MSTTLIPDRPDVLGDTETTFGFDETPEATQQRTQWPIARQWWLIGGLVGGSIALATTATLVANKFARRATEPPRHFGVRPMRGYGVRHVATPRGGSAWFAYIYRLPDLRLQLPGMRLFKTALPITGRRHRLIGWQR
jgi:hypothetical protein